MYIDPNRYRIRLSHLNPLADSNVFLKNTHHQEPPRTLKRGNAFVFRTFTYLMGYAGNAQLIGSHCGRKAEAHVDTVYEI